MISATCRCIMTAMHSLPPAMRHAEQLDDQGFTLVQGALSPAQSSFYTALAMQIARSRGVEVGRLFPALPNFMRVTIGTGAEMKQFLSAFKDVMA